jgi:hypothetical protein
VRGAEWLFVLGLCLTILVYCGLTIAGEWWSVLAKRREKINLGLRVTIFVLVAAYLLWNLPVGDF